MNKFGSLTFLTLMNLLMGCEPTPSSRGTEAQLVVNGEVFTIKPDATLDVSFENGKATVTEIQKPVEQFSVKIVAVDFTYIEYGADCSLYRIITCEYENGRHYAKTKEPFKNAPYPNEIWLVHYDSSNEIVFDSIAQ